MWTVVGLLFIACQLSRYAIADSAPVRNQPSCHDPRVCLEEQTSLLQTSSFVQKRGTVASALPIDTPSAVAARGLVQSVHRGLPAEEQDLDTDPDDELDVDSDRPADKGYLEGGRADKDTVAKADSDDDKDDPHQPPYKKSPPPEPGVVAFGRVITITGFSIIVLFFVGAKCLPRRSPMNAEGIEKMRRSWTVWLLSLSYCTVQMITTDQYLPSLAKMQVDLGTTPLKMSVTLQVNWLLKGISALSMAALSNHFGRKPMLLLCCLLTCAGSLSCACATNFWWFLSGRILQGLSEGGEPIFAMIARDMIADPHERMAYTAGYFSVLFLVPIIAPALGGFVAHWTTWRLPFLMLSIWGLINTILILPVFGETRKLDLTDRTRAEYRAELQRIFSDKQLAVLAVVQAAGVMLIFSVDTSFSLLLSNVFYQNQFDVALKLAFIAVVCVASSIVLEILAKPFGSLKVLQGAMACSVIPIVGTFLVGLYADRSWVWLFASICTVLLVSVVSCIAADALYYMNVQDVSGPAAGINTFISMAFASVGTFISGMCVEHTRHHVQALAFWLGGTMLVIATIFWLVFGLKPPKWAREPGEDDPFDTNQSLDESEMKAKMPLPTLPEKNKDKNCDCFEGVTTTRGA